MAEKLHKPKRKETVTEILRLGVKQLEVYRHPKILSVLHPIEECPDALAFATEPVYASLASILAFQESPAPNHSTNPVTGGSGSSPPPANQSTSRPTHAREYHFLDIEIKYGVAQIMDALLFLHQTCHFVHRNVCPSSIIVNKKGTWKLAGLDFMEATSEEPNEPVPCQIWSSRFPKMAQPDLDYIAPEIQKESCCSTMSDAYSLGMTIAAIFNSGKSLIQANHSASNHLKQVSLVQDQLTNMSTSIPIPLQEPVRKLLEEDVKERVSTSVLVQYSYFNDPVIQALQFLDVISMKDPATKTVFYKETLIRALPYIPKKLWFQHVWPSLQQEMRTAEVLASVLQPIIYLIQECSLEEYENIILPAFRSVFSAPKSIQATVTLLENLHVILEKTPRDDIRNEVLPMLYNGFESSTIQVQSAALQALTNVSEYLDEIAIRRMVLPKMKAVYEKNASDLKLVGNILACIERTIEKLDRQQIIDDVLPLLWDVKLQDPDIMLRVVNIYRLMLSDKRYGLSVNLMATRVMPSLLPQTVNPQLNLEQFTCLLEVLQEMLDQIDRNQRNKLKLDNMTLPSPERHRPLRHLYSSDNMHVPPFNIPNLRIEQRKTSSAEDMQRKNSTDSGILGGWWYGISPSSPDSNFLRVANALPNMRRLSDNTLMTPKIRIAPSCASSPGGTPGGGLPTRRHSSIGPQERRGSSSVNLSPPTLARSMIGGSMPNTSSSVPFLSFGGGSMQSIRSRRPSQCSNSSLLQQLGSGMVRQLSSSGSPQHPTHANGRTFAGIPANYQLFNSGRS
ncbi:hypothetical protein M8J76_007507 [Diaphorina citri]|nr:hypothetical protein M8J76_007507 [Diaphorina citri]